MRSTLLALRRSLLPATTAATVATCQSQSQLRCEDGRAKHAARSKLRFGIITDIQYADVDNRGRPERNYRGTLKLVEDAVAYFNQHAAIEPLAFVAHLGDIIDDCNSKVDDGKTSEAALNEVMKRLCKLTHPHVRDTTKFLIGNHEMYNFSREQLCQGVETSHGTFKCADGAGSTFYSWSPNSHWRMIVLDPYIESVHAGGRGSGLDEEATQLMCAKNKNVSAKMQSDGEEARKKETIQCDYFEGVEGLERRFCPFNGGLGKTQCAWLQAQLQEATREEQRVVILSHLLFHPEATRAPATEEWHCYGKTLAWDYEEVLNMLRSPAGRCVVACLHGHQHEGGFHTDEQGIHHIVFESPLLGPSHAIVELTDEWLTLTGFRIDGVGSLVFPGGPRGVECRRVLQLRQ